MSPTPISPLRTLLPDSLPILTHAAGQLAAVLDEARLTVHDPDYRGPEWHELCRGNRLLPLYTMVDLQGNVMHARREGTSFASETITLTYLPSWFVSIVDNVPDRKLSRLCRPGSARTHTAQVSDRDLAVPLRVTMRVKRRFAAATLPQIGYDLQPSHGSLTLAEGRDPAEVARMDPGLARATAIERIHWIAPSVRITAAPGAAVTVEEIFPVVGDFDPWSIDLSGGVEFLASTPLWGWFVMHAAREQHDLVRASSRSTITAQHALAVQVERTQNAETVPLPGAPRRTGGISEVDLLMGDWGAGERIEEVTRPDGIDLLFLTLDASMSLQRQRSDIREMILGAIDPYVYGVSGALPPDTPIPVRIRVDPQSAEDRFAYTVSRLPRSGGRTQLFRLAVVKTKHVRVTADLFFLGKGEDQLARLLDYRELDADFDEVPTALTDRGESLPRRDIERRSLSTEEIADAVLLAIGLLPFPPCQVISDLNDYATILRYLVDGKDTLGRDMTRLDFALSCAGVLLPEVLEVVARKASRLITAGDGPGRRIAETFAEVAPTDLSLTSAALREAAK